MKQYSSNFCKAQISENMEIGYNVKDMCPASSKEVSVRSSQADENGEDKLKIEEREGEAKTSRQIQEALANLLIGETATAIRGDAGLSEGENQSKSLSFAKVDSAESCKESEEHQADEVSNWTHTKRTENETEKQKTREKTVTTMEETLKKEKGLREPEDTTDFEVIRQDLTPLEMMVEEDESEETKRQQQRASNYSEDSVAEEAAEDYKREMVVQFESGGSMKIGKPVEEATVARKAEEHVTSEHTSNAGESRIELISYRSIEKILDDAEEEMEVEMQKKEETSDIHLDTIIIKSDKTQKNTKEDKNNILCIKNEAFSESFQDPRDDKQQDDQEEPVNKLKVGNQNDTSYKEMDNIKIHINGEEVYKGNKAATIGEDTSKQIIDEKSDPSTERLIVKDTIKGSDEDKEEREKITIESYEESVQAGANNRVEEQLIEESTPRKLTSFVGEEIFQEFLNEDEIIGVQLNQEVRDSYSEYTKENTAEEECIVTDIHHDPIEKETVNRSHDNEKESQDSKSEIREELETIGLSETIRDEILDNDDTSDDQHIPSLRGNRNEEPSQEGEIEAKNPKEGVKPDNEDLPSTTEEAVQVYKTEQENHVETGDSVKKEKPIEEASAVKETDENVNFEHISNAGASRMELISKTSPQKLVDDNKLDLEEKLEVEDAKENKEAKMKKKEEVSHIHLDDIPVKSEKTKNTTMEDKSNILCINHEASKESFQEPMNDNKQDNKEEVVNGLSSGHQSDKGYMETENTKIDINGKEVHQGSKAAAIEGDTNKQIIEEECLFREPSSKPTVEETVKASQEEKEEGNKPTIEAYKESMHVGANNTVEEQLIEESSPRELTSFVGEDTSKESLQEDEIIAMQLNHEIKDPYSEFTKENTAEEECIITAINQDPIGEQKVITSQADKKDAEDSKFEIKEEPGTTVVRDTTRKEISEDDDTTNDQHILSIRGKQKGAPSQEDELQTKNPIEEVKVSNLGRARTSTDEPEHESQNDMLRNTKPADEDTLAKESKEKLVGSSSSEKANKKGIVEEILENTIDMHSASGTVTTDETSLEETEPEIKLKDTPDADSTEAAATAETNSTNGDGTSISLKSETNMKHSSTPPTEENEVMILDSSKKIDEISSNDHIPSENPNTPRTTQTKEEKLQKEDDSTIPINISKVGSTEIESESVVEKNVDEGACMFSKLRTDKTITESENDEHFERENIADEWEVESHAHESEPFDTKHEKTPREEFRSCSLANNSMTSKKTEIQAPDSDNSTLAETSHAKMYNEVNEKSYLGLDKQKTDELSIPNDKDNSIEDDKQQTKDEFPMGAPTSEGQRKPNETEIQGVICKDEDEENHDSAKIALSDVLQKSTNEALEIDSKLTEGNQPTTTTTELDSKEAEAGQFDEAKKDDEEEAYQQKTAEPEKLPQEERNDKIGANSKHLPDQQVEEATAESTKEMEQKLDAGYQHKKMQNAHKTTILTEEIFEGSEKAKENETIGKREEEYKKELPTASGEDEIVNKVQDFSVVSILQNHKAAESIDITEVVSIKGNKDFNMKPQSSPFTKTREEEEEEEEEEEDAILKEERKYDEPDSASITLPSENTNMQIDKDIGPATLSNMKSAYEVTPSKYCKEKLVENSPSDNFNEQGIIEEKNAAVMSKDLQSALGTVITDETALEEAELELKMKDSPNADSAEVVATVETKITNADGTRISLKSEENMKHSSILPTEENELMILDSSKKTDETSLNDEIPFEKPNTSCITQTTEEKSHKEDESTSPINDSQVGKSEQNVEETNMLSKVKIDNGITASKNDEHFEREKVADDVEAEGFSKSHEPSDNKHEETPEEIGSCYLVTNDMSEMKKAFHAPEVDNLTQAETSQEKMCIKENENIENEKRSFGAEKQKKDELGIPNDNDEIIEDDKQQRKDKFPVGPPTTENQRRLDVVDIQGALRKNEDEEMHDSANAPSSDLLEKTTKEPFQMDSHLTEEKQPMKTKELDSDSAVTGQVDEAEKGPQEKLNYKIEVITEHFPEQQVQEGTTESTKEIKLDAEYQDNKTQNANITSVLTEKISKGSEKAEESENTCKICEESNTEELHKVFRNEEMVDKVEDSNVVSIQNPKAATSIDFTEPVNIEGEEDFNPKPELTPFTEPREEEALLKEEKKYDDLDSASVTRKSRNTIEGAQTDEDIGAHTEDWHSETNQKTETILQSEQSESTKLQKEIKAAAEKGFESKHQGNKEINEAWIGCSQPPPIRNSEDHASTETIEIVEQKHWKESNTVDGSSKFGDQEDVSETNSDNILSEIQKIEELTPEDKGEKCKEESKLEYEKTEKNLDSVPEIHNDDTVSKIEKPEIKKSRSKADIAELTAQENHCEKEVEANETITNKTSDEKVHNSDMVIVHHEEDTINNAMKETVIVKNEEEPKTKFDIPPLANAASEETLPGKFSDKVEYLSECLPKNPNDEIIDMNEKEIHAPNTEKSPLIGTSQEKTHTKESETTNHEEGYDSELEKHKTDKLSIQREDIECENELNEVPVEVPSMTNKRLDDLDILDAELAGEDKETCDSAKTLISDQLQESARGTSQLDGHLTEGEEPIEKKEKLETEVTEQVDEAKTEEEEEADEHNKTASENAPHEKISDKSRSTSEDVSEEEVKEGTMENNEEISEKKLADGYQHNKIEDVHKTVFTTLLTKESTLKELHTASREDEAVNKVEGSSILTIWNPEAAYSVDNAETENLKSEEDLNATPESSPLTETQEDILKEEITYGGVDSLYAKLESKSTIMHDAQLDEVIGTDNEDQCSKTTETTENILQSEQNESTKHEEEIKEAAEIEHELKHHGDKEMNEELTDISHPLLAGNSEVRGNKEPNDITEDKRGSENEIDEKEYQQVILVKRTEAILPNEGSKSIAIYTPMSEHQGVSDPKSAKSLLQHKEIKEPTRQEANEYNENSEREFEKTDKNLESVGKIHSHDQVTKLETPELKEVHRMTKTAELTVEEKYCKKAIEANERINDGEIINEKVHSLDFVMVKHREDTSNEEMKETIGEEDEEESNTNINVPPAANVDAEEEPQENVVNRMKDLSECLTKEQGDEISTTNENKKEIHASNMDKLKNSPLAETFQENMHNKESETTDEKMNGLERENQKAAELSTPKDKAEDIEDEKQQMKDEDPLEDQIMENRRRPHKEIQGAVCANEDEQTHDLAELSLYDVLHKSGKDQEAERAELTAGKNQCENAIEANERINDEVLNEKVQNSDSVMVKHEPDPINDEKIETVSIKDKEESNKDLDIPPAADVQIEGAPQEKVPDRIEDLCKRLPKEQGYEIIKIGKGIQCSNTDKSENSPLAETFQEKMYHEENETNNDEKRNDLALEKQKAAELSMLKYKGEGLEDEKQHNNNKYEVPVEAPTIENQRRLHEEIQGATSQRNVQLPEDRESATQKEAITGQVVEAKTDEEEESDKHKKADSGSDAPVVVEASRDLDFMVAHKKSHHILSGVGAKVKHSIAKVKRVITGKSSHSKPLSSK